MPLIKILVIVNHKSVVVGCKSNISPNERLTEEQKKPVGYFVFHNNKWLLINQRLNDLEDKTEGVKIPINQSVELTDGKQILLSKEFGGRLIIVQLVTD